ncbi:ABC transporter ATP-binding protein [Kineosporia sp. J2-2]|uniref:ABC transporter ATP-binding protein n=1 Tax=Kineosporia corallincola TaxID=2835133 RepID=A0ABS5TM58_9ACTN|nr:ABC transporter ATP-binding protein [Kineosporia corallincola]MBT0772188.1 ABC transporter ATP-binding protein [Kineosporia corallincola]
MSAVLEISGLSVAYRPNRRQAGVPAVKDVSLSLEPGRTLAVVGESGSGKSTLAAAVLGLLPGNGAVTGGSVTVAGRQVVGARERELRDLRGRVVALVPQDPTVTLNPTRRIGPQVAESVLRRTDVARRSVPAEVLAALTAAGLDRPELRARQYPHELSGGMRQRVLIAAALAGRPRLLIADEPTSALDVTVQKRILDHLRQLVAERGISLLLITHDLGVAADRADRVVVMRAGEVVESGPAAAVLGSPSTDYTRELVRAAPGFSVGSRPAAEPVAGSSSSVVLRLENLSKDYVLPGGGVHRALDDVTLAVPAGQTLGLVGESGSGKTTALRIALGLITPTTGRVLLDGQDLTGLGWRQLRPLRRRFQLVHQNPFSALDPRFTVEQTISEPLVSFRVGDRASRRERVRELLDAVGLPTIYAGRLPSELSGGQRQRVAIARALSLEPELLLLDEPVSALDVRVQEQILNLLTSLQKDLGLSYLFVSHDLAVVAGLSHRVAVLRHGKLVEEGPTGQVFAAPRSEYTQELLNAIAGRGLPRAQPAESSTGLSRPL